MKVNITYIVIGTLAMLIRLVLFAGAFYLAYAYYFGLPQDGPNDYWIRFFVYLASALGVYLSLRPLILGR